MLCRILDLNELNCNEMDVFDACIQWAQSYCKQKHIDGAKIGNVRAALGEAIFKIRFCSMTVEQFAGIDKKYSGFFSVNESNEIYRTIGKAHDIKLSAFNTTSKPRTPKSTAAATTIRPKAGAVTKKVPSLECIISDECARNNWGDQRSESDIIAFLCDKTIQLHGFCVCLEVADKMVIDVEAGARCLNDCKHITSILKDKSEITKITFAEPIQVNRNECCFITVKSKKFQQPGLRFGIKPETVQDGVWFQLPRPRPGDCKPKSITRLLFSIGE